MSKHFEKVKDYFERNIWGIARVREAVVKQWITKSEYKKITGETF